MKYTFVVAALAGLGSSKEIPKDPARAAELYDSGVMHERIMAEKEAEWSANSFSINAVEGPQWPELHFAQCKNGQAVPFRDQPTNFFRCNNVSGLATKHSLPWPLRRLTDEFRSTSTTSCLTLTLAPPLVEVAPHGAGCPMMVVNLLSSHKQMAQLSLKSPMLVNCDTLVACPRPRVPSPRFGGRSEDSNTISSLDQNRSNTTFKSLTSKNSLT